MDGKFDLSLHLPLSEETKHFIGENELKLMKSSAMLINTLRGQIVDQVALLNAIKTGKIAGAGLDVTDPVFRSIGSRRRRRSEPADLGI